MRGGETMKMIQKLKQAWWQLRRRLKIRELDRGRRKRYAEALIVEMNQMIKKYPDVDFGLGSRKKYTLSEKRWSRRQEFCLLTPLPVIFFWGIPIITRTSLFALAMSNLGWALTYVMVWDGMALLFTVPKLKDWHDVGYSRYYIGRLESDCRQMALAIQLNGMQKPPEKRTHSFEDFVENLFKDWGPERSNSAEEQVRLDSTEKQTIISTGVDLIEGLLNLQGCTSDADLFYGLTLIYRRLLREGEPYGVKPRKIYCRWTHYEWWVGGIIVPMFATLTAGMVRIFVALAFLKPLDVSLNWSWAAAVVAWVVAYVLAARECGVSEGIPLVGESRAIDVLNCEIETLARQIALAKEAESQHRERLKVAFRALEALIKDQLHGYCYSNLDDETRELYVSASFEVERDDDWETVLSWRLATDDKTLRTSKEFKLTDEDCRELTQLVLMNLTMASRRAKDASAEKSSSQECEDELINRLEALRSAYENDEHIDDLLAGLLQ